MQFEDDKIPHRSLSPAAATGALCLRPLIILRELRQPRDKHFAAVVTITASRRISRSRARIENRLSRVVWICNSLFLSLAPSLSLYPL